MTLAVNLRRSGGGLGGLPTFIASEWADSAGADVGSITIAKPLGTTTGDLMLSVVSGRNTGGFSGDTDWTEVADLGESQCPMRVAWKLAAAAEPSDYTFTVSGGIEQLGGYIQTWRNAVFDAVGSFYSGKSTNDIVMPEISPTATAILHAFVASSQNAIGFSTPSGMTARDADNTYRPSMATFYESVASGATGTRTSTPDGIGNHRGILVAIRGA